MFRTLVCTLVLVGCASSAPAHERSGAAPLLRSSDYLKNNNRDAGPTPVAPDLEEANAHFDRGKW